MLPCSSATAVNSKSKWLSASSLTVSLTVSRLPARSGEGHDLARCVVRLVGLQGREPIEFGIGRAAAADEQDAVARGRHGTAPRRSTVVGLASTANVAFQSTKRSTEVSATPFDYRRQSARCCCAAAAPRDERCAACSARQSGKGLRDSRRRFRRLRRLRSVVAAGDEHVTVEERCRRQLHTCSGQRNGQHRSRPACRIEDLGRRKRGTAVPAADDQNAVVRETSCGMLGPRQREAARCRRGPGGRVEELRGVRQPLSGAAASEEKASIAERGHRVAGASDAHSTGVLPRGRRGIVESDRCRGLAVNAGSAADDKPAIRQHRRRRVSR